MYPKFFISSITVILLIAIGSYMSFIERRLIGLFQNRYGPNRVGWEGSLQVVADMLKTLFKEDWIPPFSEKFIFLISPVFSFILSLITFTIIPVTQNWIILDTEYGIIVFIMLSSISVYPILLSGFSSNNKYALIGSIRSIAQTLSYEIFLGLSVIGVVIQSESFNLVEIAIKQKNMWNIIPQFLGFINFIISGVSICHRHPFDQPESEQELCSGYHIEYSGVKFSLFFISEYISMISISSFITTIFLGGWNGPIFNPFIWFAIKTSIFLIFFILLRSSLPRARYDQIINLGWKFCFPLSLLNILITAFLKLLNS